MKKTIKTGLAAMVLLLAFSCKKEITTMQSPVNTDEIASQTLLTNADALGPYAVKIGTQIWKKTDLATSYYRNGDKIPQVKDPVKWSKLTTGAWCWYNNDPSYGKLYNWYAVNDPRGLAPAGWHVPSNAEWNTLTAFLGGYTLAGGKMKEAGTTHWIDPNVDATNSTGWTGLPGGSRYDNGGFFDNGGYGYWWSSTSAAPNAAWYRYLTYFYGAISGTTDYKLNGFSVRCIKD